MAGFWAGFGETVSKGIEDRQAFIREETARRQEYLRTVGIPAIQQRNAKIQDGVNEIQQAVALGLRPEVAAAAWESGTLPAVVENIVGAGDKSAQAAEHFNSIQDLSADYVRQSANPEDVVKRVYTTATSIPTDYGSEESRNANIFETMFAIDPQKAADRAMQDYTVGGYTEADASAAIASGGSRSVNVPQGYKYTGVPARSANIGPEDLRPQLNDFRNSFSTYTGDSVKYIGDNAVVEGANKQATEMAANKANHVFFTLLESGDYSPQDLRYTINTLAELFFTTPKKAEDGPDFVGFRDALDLLLNGGDIQSFIDEYTADSTPPETAPQPTPTNTTEEDGVFDPVVVIQ